MTSALNPEPNNDRNLTNSSFRDSQPLLEEEFSNSQVAWSVELTQLPQDVIQELHQATSKEKILTITVEEARRLMECERAVIYSLTEPSRGTVIAEAVIPGWRKTLGMTIDDPCLEAKCMDIYQNGQVKAFNDIYSSEIGQYYIEQLEDIEVKASLVAPILQKGKLFGLLVIHQCSQPRQWQPEEIECLSQLATQAGLTLNNAKLLAESARLKQQAEIEAQWTKFFTDATRHIRQSLNQKDILNVTVEEVRRVLDCQRVVVYSLNEDKYGVVIAESVTPGWTRALGITIKDPCFESKYLEKYENGRVRALDNIHEAGMTSCYIEQLEKLEVKANLVTPIINEGKLFGLLVAHQCSSPRTWQQYEIRWVTQIATQVGFALDNAKLLASSTDLQQQADSGNQWTRALQECIKYLRGYNKQSDILAMSVEEARRVLNCDRVVVYGLNRDSYGKVIAESVAPGWTRSIGITIQDPCFETRYLEKYQNGRVEALDNIYKAGMTLCYVEQLEKLEVKANLVTPIIVENKIFGLLVAHHCEQPHKWQPQEIDFLSKLATQVGLALERAQLIAKREQLEKQTETETQWTQFFTQAVRHIRQSLQQKDILNISVEEVRRALKCDRVVVYSLNQDKYGEVIAESVTLGWTRALGKIINDPCFEARYLEKYRDGRVRALDNIYESGMTSCYIEQLEKLEVKANLVTPIINEGKLFGLLVAHQCSAPRQWQQYEIRWVTQIATQVGFALDNAKLLRELEQSSLTANKIFDRVQQQKEVADRQVSEILADSTATYQTLSQEALQQSETVMDVLHQIQEVSDAVRGQVVDIQQVKRQEQQDTLKIQLLQETLNQTVGSITAIQDSVNDAAVKIMHLSQSSPKLVEIVNLIQDLGKQIAQQSMNVTIAISRTERIPQDSVVELTDTVLSSMQQLYEASAQINPLLFTLETATREAVTALDSSRLKLTNGTDALKDVQQKLNQIPLANINRGLLVDKIARAAENQIQVSASVRQSIQEVANLANNISKHSLAIAESFNRLAALTKQL
ncbi:MAG: GAF domain-containing protein [Xenococcaceae cyanobacterium MO_188.B32]|nr:GAF domain-containing protein [Xenococcaceae cyanobacterium MO_188.B32]